MTSASNRTVLLATRARDDLLGLPWGVKQAVLAVIRSLEIGSDMPASAVHHGEGKWAMLRVPAATDLSSATTPDDDADLAPGDIVILYRVVDDDEAGQLGSGSAVLIASILTAADLLRKPPS